MSNWTDTIINTIKLIEAESYTKGYSVGYERAINDFLNADYLNILDEKKNTSDDQI